MENLPRGAHGGLCGVTLQKAGLAKCSTDVFVEGEKSKARSPHMGYMAGRLSVTQKASAAKRTLFVPLVVP